jgi:hypothetical protein
MKRAGLVWLVLTGVMVTGVFVGCGTFDVTIDKEAVDRVDVIVEDSPDAIVSANTGNTFRIKTNGKTKITVALKAVPLVPVTRAIIERIRNDRNDRKEDLKDFQYYLSDPITPNLGTRRNFLEVNNKGEGVFTQTHIPIQVPIAKETPMVFKAWGKLSSDTYLEVYFDRDDKNTLRFKENSAGRYDLVGITYGPKYYLFEAYPNRQLFIRYREETIHRPTTTQTPTGRDITKELR